LSHPMRVRGLKQRRELREIRTGIVAPHAGAWIETTAQPRPVDLLSVAPHAGAWIETRAKSICGQRGKRVAPHAGAWIETPCLVEVFRLGN